MIFVFLSLSFQYSIFSICRLVGTHTVVHTELIRDPCEGIPIHSSLRSLP